MGRGILAEYRQVQDLPSFCYTHHTCISCAYFLLCQFPRNNSLSDYHCYHFSFFFLPSFPFFCSLSCLACLLSPLFPFFLSPFSFLSGLSPAEHILRIDGILPSSCWQQATSYGHLHNCPNEREPLTLCLPFLPSLLLGFNA